MDILLNLPRPHLQMRLMSSEKIESGPGSNNKRDDANVWDKHAIVAPRSTHMMTEFGFVSFLRCCSCSCCSCSCSCSFVLFFFVFRFNNPTTIIYDFRDEWVGGLLVVYFYFLLCYEWNYISTKKNYNLIHTIRLSKLLSCYPWHYALWDILIWWRFWTKGMS